MENASSATTRPAGYAAGLGFVVLASVLWSLNGALIKMLNQFGLHGITITCWRSLFAGLFLVPLAWQGFATLRPVGGRTRWPKPGVLATIVVFTLMTTTFVISTTKTEAANAIILQYTSTFWIFGLSPLMTGEKPSARDIPFLVLAMGGVATIFVGEAREAGTDLPGLVIALTAGFFYGLLVLMLRRIRECHPAAVTVVNNLGAAVMLVIPALWIGNLIPPTKALVVLLFMGVVQLGLPYYFFSRGLKLVPAHQAAMVTMLEPVLVPIWAYLAVAEKVRWHTVAGGGVILLALMLFLGTTGWRASGRNLALKR